MASRRYRRAWGDWGVVNPFYAVLTHPNFRHGGGPTSEFFDSGEGTVASLLEELSRLGLSSWREAALDFGCGIGRLTIPLSHYFDSVTGVDIAPSMLERARRLHGDVGNCRFVCNTSNGLPWVADDSIDMVLCLLVLQHLESTAAIELYLAEFVRILKRGGAAVVQLPLQVPAHRPPRPPLISRQGSKAQAAILLRRIGVSPSVLYAHLDWVPEMTLLALPEARVRAAVERAGGRIRHMTEPNADAGGTVDRLYFVTR